MFDSSARTVYFCPPAALQLLLWERMAILLARQHIPEVLSKQSFENGKVCQRMTCCMRGFECNRMSVAH